MSTAGQGEPVTFREYSGEALLREAKKRRRSAIGAAFVIGFMGGIVIYSVVKNTWGLLTLIPLFFIWRLTRYPGAKEEELKQELKERGLG